MHVCARELHLSCCVVLCVVLSFTLTCLIIVKAVRFASVATVCTTSGTVVRRFRAVSMEKRLEPVMVQTMKVEKMMPR